ncbi:MAG: signal recognition particle-docking protein FtsY [Pirellulales bacterium]|nr:signal recognition particle-docking protein FtsY [Pirellulales bacterium]
MGLFDKFKKGVAKVANVVQQGTKKTRDALKTDIRDLFSRKEGKLLDEDFLEQMMELLVRTDMGYAAADEIVGEIRKKFQARKVTRDGVIDVIKEKLNELLQQDKAPINYAESGPTVIMVVGVNGSGKTTTIAKLTHHFNAEGKSVVLGAGDTFRAAAVEQLTIWADRIGAEIVVGEQGSDPASVAFRAVEKALESNADICIVDTAGRLQTQQNLMQELTRIHRVISKQVPPHEVLLVLDATTGQPGIAQAKGFTDAVECTGIVLAKFDGTAKGGVVVPIRQQVGIPVKFVGLGETPADLAPFDSLSFTQALFEDDEE